jgi:hypothetical protein
MTLNEKLSSMGWTTKTSVVPNCKAIYDAEGKFVNNCTAAQCWDLLKEIEKGASNVGS